MIEVLRLSVENIRAYLALQEASKLTIDKAWIDTTQPQIEDLRSTIERLESFLARYETELPMRTRKAQARNL